LPSSPTPSHINFRSSGSKRLEAEAGSSSEDLASASSHTGALLYAAMQQTLEQALDCAESVIESAQQRPPKRKYSPSGEKSLHQKLYDIYVEECEKEPEATEELRGNVNLLEKLVARESLPCLVVNLYPGKEGYSLMLKENNESCSETIRMAYEEGELLEYLDAEELPPVLVDLLEKCEMNIFHRGCVITEVRDYRQCSNMEPPGYQSRHILLRPTMQTLVTDVQSIAGNDQNWTQEDKLLLESQLILATAEPLCLDPSVTVACTENRLLYNKQKMNTHPMKQNFKRYSMPSLNREQELALLPAPEQGVSTSCKKGQESRTDEHCVLTFPTAGKCIDIWKQRPCDLDIPSEVDVEKYAKGNMSVEGEDSEPTVWPTQEVEDDYVFGSEVGHQYQKKKLPFMQSLNDPLFSGRVSSSKKVRYEKQMSPSHCSMDDQSFMPGLKTDAEMIVSQSKELVQEKADSPVNLSYSSSESPSPSQLSPEKETEQPESMPVQSLVLRKGVKQLPLSTKHPSSSENSSPGNNFIPQQASNFLKSLSPTPASKSSTLPQKFSVEMDQLGMVPVDSLSAVSSSQSTPALSTAMSSQRTPAQSTVSSSESSLSLSTIGSSLRTPGLPDRIPTLSSVSSSQRIPTLSSVGSSQRIPTLSTVSSSQRIPTLSTVDSSQRIPTLSTVDSSQRIPTLSTVSSSQRIPTLSTVSSAPRIPALSTVSSPQRTPSLLTVISSQSTPGLSTVSSPQRIPALSTVSSSQRTPAPSTVSSLKGIPASSTVNPSQRLPVTQVMANSSGLNIINVVGPVLGAQALVSGSNTVQGSTPGAVAPAGSRPSNQPSQGQTPNVLPVALQEPSQVGMQLFLENNSSLGSLTLLQVPQGSLILNTQQQPQKLQQSLQMQQPQQSQQQWLYQLIPQLQQSSSSCPQQPVSQGSSAQGSTSQASSLSAQQAVVINLTGVGTFTQPQAAVLSQLSSAQSGPEQSQTQQIFQLPSTLQQHQSHLQHQQQPPLQLQQQPKPQPYPQPRVQPRPQPRLQPRPQPQLQPRPQPWPQLQSQQIQWGILQQPLAMATVATQSAQPHPAIEETAISVK
ncbi:Transcription factor SPT20, partial [Galemys pyrenaicus]